MITTTLNLLENDSSAKDISNTLLISRNSQRESYQTIRSILPPEATRTHTPIQHGLFIDLVAQGVAAKNWTITASTYASSFDQANAHFVFEIDYEFVPGIRMFVAGHNSNNKMRAATIQLQTENQGANCTNMDMVGRVQLKRKHTPNIMRELPYLVGSALDNLETYKDEHTNRLEKYTECTITNKDASDIIIKAMEAGAVPSTYIPEVVEEWRVPSHESLQPRTLFSLYNCFTASWRRTPANTPERSTILMDLIDQQAEWNWHSDGTVRLSPGQ